VEVLYAVSTVLYLPKCPAQRNATQRITPQHSTAQHKHSAPPLCSASVVRPSIDGYNVAYRTVVRAMMTGEPLHHVAKGHESAHRHVRCRQSAAEPELMGLLLLPLLGLRSRFPQTSFSVQHQHFLKRRPLTSSAGAEQRRRRLTRL
jgi:hypothetical protein